LREGLGEIRLRKAQLKDVAHGRSFEMVARRINEVKGTDFVTVRSDEDVGEATPVFVLVKPLGGETWAWSWAKKMTPKQQAWVAHYRAKGWRMGVSKMYELTEGARISRSYSYTRSSKFVAELQRVWESGK
jgi:hypothetical protein